MATVPPIHTSAPHQTIFEREHPRWIKAFQRDVRSQQLADDDQAWAAVTGTLISIVTIGVILAVVSVAICLWN